MENAIIILALLALVIFIVRFLLREKKKGTTCIGCPYGKHCSGKCNSK